jgi:hypothetical protein
MRRQSSGIKGAVNLCLVEQPAHHPAVLRSQIDRYRLMFVAVAPSPSPLEMGPGRLNLRAIAWVI